MGTLIIWSVKKLVNVLKQRIENEFDGNIVVSGSRGDGKSCLINKICYRFKGFKPWKSQVYNREDIINLLKYQQYGICFDDESINSGYKRDFQKKGQQELIKILTAYRDNFNIHASAIPNFFSLDKDLRDLYFLHLHVIKRGVAIVHTPLQGRLYSQDKWDVRYNSKLEYTWSQIRQKDPTYNPPYHKLTTFKGILYFGDFTKKQEELYKLIKKEKRKQSFLTEEEKKKELPFIEKVYNALINKKLTRDGLLRACLIEGRKYKIITTLLNQMLTDNGIKETLKDFLISEDKIKSNKEVSKEIRDIIPEVEI